MPARPLTVGLEDCFALCAMEQQAVDRHVLLGTGAGPLHAGARAWAGASLHSTVCVMGRSLWTCTRQLGRGSPLFAPSGSCLTYHSCARYGRWGGRGSWDGVCVCVWVRSFWRWGYIYVCRWSCGRTGQLYAVPWVGGPVTNGYRWVRVSEPAAPFLCQRVHPCFLLRAGTGSSPFRGVCMCAQARIGVSMQQPGRGSPLASARASGSFLAQAMTRCVFVCRWYVDICLPPARSAFFRTLTAAWFGTAGAFIRPLTNTYDRQFRIRGGGGGHTLCIYAPSAAGLVQAWLFFT